MPPDGKYAQGLRGFPTPNDIPDDGGYVVFRIPQSNEYAGLILGAAQALTYPWNWYQWGDLTPDEAAERFAEIVRCAPYNLMETGVPAPYWDDAEDADDEEPPDEQPWYGRVEGLTFIEELEIWLITGFIAYSGDIGAAIAFKTFAPKFVLAWKRGGVAAAVEVFIDGVSAGELEIGSGEGIAEAEILAGVDEMEREVMIVYNGEVGGVRRTKTPRRI